MSQFSTLNVEQSIARFLADKFILEDYSIYWADTGQTEGAGSTELSLAREFPSEPSLLVSQDSARTEGVVRVPAFAIFANLPSTSTTARQGIGEGVFEWNISLRIEGFAENEFSWYKMQTFLKDWFNPDSRVNLYDYEADINSISPEILEQTMEFVNPQVVRKELGYINAARYYLFLSTKVTFIE